uniref:K Homology domain-containing protein n=1 Tax=Leersia perrieri TaxID=77586 RepID=A0A0D9VDX6_9ORYZ
MADDHYSSKRKYDDPSPPRRRTGFSSAPPTASPPSGGGGGGSYNSVPPPPTDEIQLAKQRAQAIAARIFNAAEAKRPRVDSADDDDAGAGAGAGSFGGGGGGGTGLGFSSSAGGGHGSAIPSLSSHGSTPQYSSYGGYSQGGTSKKIEIPNGRVGVIIGKSGETIKNLQLQSGAKIQVTRDLDALPGSQTRPVELSGTPDQISRAEELINEVLAEADAASSGNISGRKYNAPQPGGEQFQMKIANNKVGLVIGKGGETIKSMQAKSGARIQVVPLHLPPGDPATERTVFIDGTQEQIEIAKQLVIEVTSENRARNPMSGGYSQQGYRPPRPQSNWGPHGAAPAQQPGYGYMQSGGYPGAPPQYGAPQQPYGSYPPASGGYQTGWDQSSNQQSQQAPPGTGYDYYNQQQQPQQQQSAPGTAAPGDATSYNSSQPPAYASQGYDSSYSQQSGGQQAYDYSSYYQAQGQQQGYSQQTGYDQQQGYGASGYGSAPNSTQDGSAPSYGGQGGASQTSPGQKTSTPAAGSHPGYSSQPPTSAAPSYPAQGSAPQSGYGAPPPQPGYGTQPQGGYGQGSYGQPPQGQKGPNSSPYGQAPPPGSAAPGGYGQYGYSQQGYGAPPPYPGAPAGYGQQQSYGDPYGSGSYGQPASYSTEATTTASQDQSASAPAPGAAFATAAAPAPAPENSGNQSPPS